MGRIRVRKADDDGRSPGHAPETEATLLGIGNDDGFVSGCGLGEHCRGGLQAQPHARRDQAHGRGA
ncbi:hypothetical protein [Thiococcus pfennigii]|jgi:hypothetical protein|uniref:hypothetical protein n=1 Tax=Thiococcus pfennigii TaxID=1057 RepID=UPI001906EF07|nr:hypothetical protein [Thiococcus pfennigii]MBK1730793.1 hypothetical protein [Thiococcus pfennigii]